MRRLVLPVVLLLGAAVPLGQASAGGCGTGSVTRTSFQTSYRSYLAVGDSMTSGDSFDPQAALPGYVRYADLVAQWLMGRQRASLAYANTAQDGEKVTEAGVARIDAEVAAHRPDLVTAMYGTTDLSLGRSVADYRAAMERIVVTPAQQGARVVLTTLPPWGPAGHAIFGIGVGSTNIALPSGTDVRLHEYNDVIKQVAAAHAQPRVADVYASFERDPSKLSLDGVHPSEAGHARIAADLIARLDEVTDRGEGGVQLPAGSRSVSLVGSTDDGTFTSALMRPPGNTGWRELAAAVSLPAGTSLRLEAVDAAGTTYTGTDVRPGSGTVRLDLRSLPAEARWAGLRVRATLHRPAGSRSPMVTRLDARYARDCDAVAPAAVELTPAEGHSGMDLPATIEARFSEPMDAASLTAPEAVRVYSLPAVTVGGTTVDPRRRVPGTVAYDAARRTVVFTPSAGLEVGHEYVVTVADTATDLVGTPLDYAVQWVFSTVPVPTF